MSIIKYDPMFRHVTKDEFLTPFDRFFDDFFKSTQPEFSKDFGLDFFEKGAYPKVDISEYKDEVVIEAAIPGLKKEEVSVEVDKHILTISGNKQFEIKENTGSQYKELKRSGFKRSFNLSENIDGENINASVENGILTIKLKKIKPTKDERRKIDIK